MRSRQISAQDSLPFEHIYGDGICRAPSRSKNINGKFYSRTIAFGDTGYRLSSNEDKTRIFDMYSKLLNSFDPSVAVQLSFVNSYISEAAALSAIALPQKGDKLDSIRREYTKVLCDKALSATNKLTRRRYITFGVHSDNAKSARNRLERLSAEVISSLGDMNVTARYLDGADMVALMRNMLDPDTRAVALDPAALASSGLSSRDLIAPPSLEFGEARTFRTGRRWGAASFLQISAPELSDALLSDLLSLDIPLNVSIHLRPIEQSEAIKNVKRLITTLDTSKIHEQKKASRSGYDTDILPSDLATYGGDAKTLLSDLQNKNERMFHATVVIINSAPIKKTLDGDVFATSGVCQKHGCAMRRLD